MSFPPGMIHKIVTTELTDDAGMSHFAINVARKHRFVNFLKKLNCVFAFQPMVFLSACIPLETLKILYKFR